MTLKEIKNEFVVYKEKKDKYYLFSKTEGGRSVHNYLTTLHRRGGISFYVDGFKPTTKINVLIKQVGDEIKSLPYASDYYNPMWRDGLFEEYIIRDYMESIGFSDHHGYYTGEYGWKLKRESIYGYSATNITITFDGLEPEFNMEGGKGYGDTVRINLHTGSSSWVSVKVKREVEAIKIGINSVLNPLLVTEASENLLIAEKTSIFDELNLVEKTISGFDIIERDLKNKLKEKLEKLLLKLT